MFLFPMKIIFSAFHVLIIRNKIVKIYELQLLFRVKKPQLYLQSNTVRRKELTFYSFFLHYCSLKARIKEQEYCKRGNCDELCVH